MPMPIQVLELFVGFQIVACILLWLSTLSPASFAIYGAYFSPINAGNSTGSGVGIVIPCIGIISNICSIWSRKNWILDLLAV
jgi:hypothetical protein